MLRPPDTSARSNQSVSLLRLLGPLVLLLCFNASAFETTRCQLADGFDFPVGKPEGTGYYKARGFWPNGHLGEDWNGSGGGDSDEGDPIYAIGRGVVVLSEDVKVGWGNVIIIRHVYREITGKVEMVDSLYGHLLTRTRRVGHTVDRGDLVGTMGGNNGMYPVHLHLEVRKNLAIGMNRSKFARDYSNYHSPTAFINAHRKLPADFRRYDVPINTFAPYGGELNEAQQVVARTTSPTTFTHRSGGGIKRTARGLSIPVITGAGGYSPGAVAAPTPSTTPTDQETKPSPVPVPVATETKSDFWSRLRAKLGNGSATPGIEDEKDKP